MCYAAESDLLRLLFFQGKLTVWKLKTECQIKCDWIQSIIGQAGVGRQIQQALRVQFFMQDSPQTMDIIMYLFGAYELCFILKPEVIAPRENNHHHPIILWEEARKHFWEYVAVVFCEDVGNIMTKYHC